MKVSKQCRSEYKGRYCQLKKYHGGMIHSTIDFWWYKKQHIRIRNLKFTPYDDAEKTFCGLHFLIEETISVKLALNHYERCSEVCYTCRKYMLKTKLSSINM